MEEPIVRVEHLSHRYSVQWAIRDINFEINQKGILGLLGSNGAGKSTTMNIICGVLNQTEGTVYINGIDTRKNPVEAKKYIGFLPQKPPLYTDHNVDEYLTYCAHLRLMDDKEVKAAVGLAKERCGIAHFSKRLVKNLSGGYQQRLGIAQAIVHNPKLVVLDEPTNGLDPNQIIEIRRLIREIAEERAVLISTHILPEVQAACDYIMMIEHGNMVFKGSIEEFNNYMDPSVLLVIMHNAPEGDSELLKIEGMERVERLTRTRFRLHFKGDDSIVSRVVNEAVRNNWHLREISLEKESLDKVFAKLSGKF